MNKKLKRKQALIMAEPYRTPFNSKVAKVSGDVIEDSVGGIKYATSFDGATKIVDANKNLLSLPDIEATTIDGITYSVKDGVITFNGTLTRTSTLDLWIPLNNSIQKNKTYYKKVFYSNTQLNEGNLWLCKEYGNYSDRFQMYYGTIDATYDITYLMIFIEMNKTYTNETYRPMLVLGTTAPTEFEPNFKNLLELADVKETTINGITYSIKDGVITFSGTATANTIINLKHGFPMPTGSYGLYIGSTSYFKIWTNTSGWLTNKKVITTTSDDSYGNILIFIDSGKVVDGVIETPTLTKGTIIPSQFIPFANPYFVSLGQNGSVQYNGLEPREIDLKGNVISKINNQASDKLSNYALTKNTKVVDLGSLTWDVVPTTQANIIRYRSEDLRYEAVFPSSNNVNANILCVKYDTVSINDSYERLIKGISLDYQYSLIIYNPEYNTSDKLEAFKKAIRGTLLMYQTKNPTTINTTSFKTFKEDTNATISDNDFTSSPNAITETFKPTRSYDFKVNGFSNVVKSSNLLNIPDKANTTTNGITYSIKDGVITLNGTNSSTSIQWIWIDFVSTLNGTYSFNSFAPTTTYVTGTRISLYDNTTEKPIAQLFNNEYSSTIELTNYECKKIGIECGAGQTFTNATIKPMLVSGSTIPTKYEPYFDPYIESFADKKNLLGFDDIEKTTTNGITYSIKNGVLKFKGSSTAPLNLFLKLKNRIAKNTIVTSNLFGNKWAYPNNIYLSETTSYDKVTTFYKRDNLPITFTTEYDYGYLLIQFNYSNIDITIKPILVNGSIAPTTFLPYQDKYSAFLNVKGKNLLDLSQISDIAFSTQDNQTITYIKDKNGAYLIKDYPLENGTYEVSLILKTKLSTSNSFYYIVSDNDPNGQSLFSNFQNLSLNEIHSKQIQITENKLSIRLWSAIGYQEFNFQMMIVKSSIIPTEFEPYYSFTKEVLIKQPLRKFDYLTYDGVYRQTNEIVLDGTNNIYVDNKGKIFLLKIPNADSVGKNWNVNVASEIMVTTSNLPLLPYYNISNDNQMGIGTNQGNIILRLDDSADNSLNNWTVEKVNNYFKQNPITITYKTVDQTFEATSLTRLLFKNGYNKITAFDSINNNAIVEYLEYYKSK